MLCGHHKLNNRAVQRRHSTNLQFRSNRGQDTAAGPAAGAVTPPKRQSWSPSWMPASLQVTAVTAHPRLQRGARCHVDLHRSGTLHMGFSTISWTALLWGSCLGTGQLAVGVQCVLGMQYQLLDPPW